MMDELIMATLHLEKSEYNETIHQNKDFPATVRDVFEINSFLCGIKYLKRNLDLKTYSGKDESGKERILPQGLVEEQFLYYYPDFKQKLMSRQRKDKWMEIPKSLMSYLVLQGKTFSDVNLFERLLSCESKEWQFIKYNTWNGQYIPSTKYGTYKVVDDETKRKLEDHAWISLTNDKGKIEVPVVPRLFISKWRKNCASIGIGNRNNELIELLKKADPDESVLGDDDVDDAQESSSIWDLVCLLALPFHLGAGLLAGIPLSLILAFYAVLIASCAFFYHAALSFALATPWLGGFQPWLGSATVLIFVFYSTMFTLSGYGGSRTPLYDLIAQQTCTLMPMTKLGLSVGLPSFCRRLRHCHFKAMPPNIAASLEPMVEQPVAASLSGAFQSLAIIFTQRNSISAVCGYSSLSIMFLSKVSAINCLVSSETVLLVGLITN